MHKKILYLITEGAYCNHNKKPKAPSNFYITTSLPRAKKFCNESGFIHPDPYNKDVFLKSRQLEEVIDYRHIVKANADPNYIFHIETNGK